MKSKEPKQPELPPHDETNEKIVLGTIIYDSENCLNIAEEFGLKQDDFYLGVHQNIWTSIEQLSQEGKHIDLVSTLQRLRNNNIKFNIQDTSKLPNHALASPELLTTYLQRLRNDSLLRQVMRTGAAFIDTAKTRPDNIDHFLDEFEKEVLEIRTFNKTQDARSAQEVGYEVMEQILSGGKPQGIHCGLNPLDSVTRGWQPSEMIIIAARPGMGKTALGLQFACNAANNKHPTAFFSQEMSAESLMYRILSGESNIPMSYLIEGPQQSLTQQSMQDIQTAAQRISQFPLYIDDEPRLTPMKIRAKCRRMKKTHNIQLIVIDYLQLLHTPERTESRQVEIAKISGLMKAMAMELNTPVIILSQLNRKVEERASGEPKLSDLRESGAIEQDADIVCMLQTIEEDKQDDSQDMPANYKIKLAKNRNGKTGDFEVTFLPHLTRFTLPS